MHTDLTVSRFTALHVHSCMHIESDMIYALMRIHARKDCIICMYGTNKTVIKVAMPFILVLVKAIYLQNVYENILL